MLRNGRMKKLGGCLSFFAIAQFCRPPKFKCFLNRFYNGGKVFVTHQRPNTGADGPSSAAVTRAAIPVAIIAAVAGLLFGYDTGIISGAILFLKIDFHLTAGSEEFVVSSVLIGAVLGAMFGGNLADRFGRRRMIIAAALVFVAGALVTALSPTLTVLVLGRVAVGIAIGAASFTAPLYISEIAPAPIRGALVSLNQLALTAGIVISYLVDYVLAKAGDWRAMFGFAAIPALVLFVGMLLLPESPRWLAGKGKIAQAEKVLMRLHHEDVPAEMAEIDRSNQDSKDSATLWAPVLRPAHIVGVGLAIFQQVTGINTIIYYAPTIFEMAGVHSATVSILATVGVGMVNVLMTIVAIRLIDKVGRRPLLLTGTFGMVISLGVLGFAFHLHTVNATLGWITAASLMVYVASFAIGLGPVFWLLISEIYPLRIRGRAMSLATVMNWAANLVVALTFLSLIQWAGRGNTFWIYGLIGIGTWVFVYKLVPETKGRSLESIEQHWVDASQSRQNASPPD